MYRGINENVHYKGYTFHVQTEDREKRAVVVSTLFYRGVIIAEERVSYGDNTSSDASGEGVGEIIRRLHLGLIERLKRGEFDERIRALLATEKEEPEERENQLLSFCCEAFIPSLKKELGVELDHEEIGRIKKEVETLEPVLSKENYLRICGVVYQMIKDRCDTSRFRSFVKGYAFRAEEDVADLPFSREVFQQVLFDDLVGAIGYTLGSALMEKVFSEVHSSFLKKKDAFRVLMNRILSSGVVQKRTTEQWRQQMAQQWEERYRSLMGNTQGDV